MRCVDSLQLPLITAQTLSHNPQNRCIPSDPDTRKILPNRQDRSSRFSRYDDFNR